MTALIALEGVSKVFPPDVVALDGVTLQIEPGEIHALVGENGAGKSTLSRIMAGEESPDSGTITWKGSSARFASARDAMAAGIGMVHQELLLVDELAAWQNVVLGVEPVGWFGRIDVERARRAVGATFERSGFDLDPDALTGSMSVAARQKLEIAKLLHRNVDLLILDEPTASLAPQEVPVLFDELRRLRDSGRTIVFVSHRLNEVLELADRVSVLRDGRLVATLQAEETDAAGLARVMVERDVVFTAVRPPSVAGEEVLRIVRARAARLGPIDLTVRAGEIVGVAGVEGNGQRELVGIVIGEEPLHGGTVSVGGHDITRAGVLDRRRHLASVAAERKVDGEAVTASIVDNARMTHHRLNPEFATLGGRVQVDARAERFVDEVQRRFDVVMSNRDQPIGSLSGGNQQKVILGRELALGRDLVVLDQPTRGLDVGSVEQVHRIILGLRTEGRAVLLVSADLDELFQLSDRLVVLRRGRVALEGPTDGLDAVRVGRAMLADAPSEPT